MVAQTSRYVDDRQSTPILFSKYRAAFAEDGKILGLDAELFSDGGWSLDLSGPVMDRALFHVDNAYYIPALSVVGHVVKTNTPSNTAFRGFGGPQGIVVIEDALSRAAESLGIDHAEIRRINLYGDGQKQPSHIMGRSSKKTGFRRSQNSFLRLPRTKSVSARLRILMPKAHG